MDTLPFHKMARLPDRLSGVDTDTGLLTIARAAGE